MRTTLQIFVVVLALLAWGLFSWAWGNFAYSLLWRFLEERFHLQEATVTGFALRHVPPLIPPILIIVFGGFFFGWWSQLLGIAPSQSADTPKTPLALSAWVTDGNIPNGEIISGIRWRPEFTKLDVFIRNPTGSSYDDVILALRPTSPVAEVAQSSSIPGVAIESKGSSDLTALIVNAATGEKLRVSVDLLATNAGYRVRCSHLGSLQELKVVMALVEMKPPTEPEGNVPYYKAFLDKNFIRRVTNDDFSTDWIGHKDGDVFGLRPKVDWLMIEGSYIADQKKISVSQKVAVGGNISFTR